MGWYIRQYNQTHADSRDLYKMLKSDPLIQQKEDAVDFKLKEGKIDFKNLSYAHYVAEEKTVNSISDEGFEIKRKQLMDDFTLSIKPGTTNAIVGPSGFGKTTLFNLLYRIYDPEDGAISIDDQNLKDLNFESFRKYISIVPQNGILFNETILFNLKYSNPEATQEEIEDICKKCLIHEKIISMKHGYQTKVGDLGGKLSGGEK